MSHYYMGFIKEGIGNIKMKLNHEQVLQILPHRDPMLLVDEVQELEPGKHVKASFYIDPNRDIFRGHFPNDPILPGVYTVEATAQAADIMLLSLPRYVGKTPLFLGINKAAFKRRILPGDTILIEGYLKHERPEKSIATCIMKATLNGELAAETEVVLAFR